MARTTTSKKTTKAVKKPQEAAEETVVVEATEPAEVEEVASVEPVAAPSEADVLREQNELLKKQLEAMQKQMESLAKPQVVQVMADTEKVHFLWQAEVSDSNVVHFGDGGMYGRIVGKTGSFYVPKSDLSRVLTEVNRLHLKRRWLIIVSGLDDEERAALGVDYKEGELLDKRAFAKMVDLGDEILEIYPALCEGHKKMVAQRYAEAFHNNNPNVTRERVLALNAMSKEAGSEKGDFTPIIEMMNQRDAE